VSCDYDRWRDQVLEILPDAEEQTVKAPGYAPSIFRKRLWTAIVSEGRCVAVRPSPTEAWHYASVNTPGTPAHVSF
jgi:hypothetical protein